MAKKRLGYVELEWTCPNCATRNPGPYKYCDACGAPQPPDVAFEQPADAELLQREDVEETLKAGPDIHCPYCGTRNRGDAGYCGSCGGDLAEGIVREAGQIVGVKSSPGSEFVHCAACGTQNALDARNCTQCGAPLSTSVPEQPIKAPPPPEREKQPATSRKLSLGLIVGGGILLLILCAAIFLVLGKREEASGIVQDLAWTRSIELEAYTEVEGENWIDDIPSDAKVFSCETKHRYTSDEPELNAVEVCGTPYTQDTGTGIGEVVQDCVYEVYDDYCTYAGFEWIVIDTFTTTGNDLNPFWVDLSILPDQREGMRDESYVVTFSSDGSYYEYTTENLEEFQQFSTGSEWLLTLNLFDAVVDVDRP